MGSWTEPSAAQLPADFLWGFATAAYQIEGAITQGGRGPSIWDSFSKITGKIADGTSGEFACDSYNRRAEDIALLKSYGAKSFRFSISWSRIIPLGGRNDPVNEEGVQHYVKFVDDLLDAGIIPMVTLFHWDVPDGIDKRYGGLLNQKEFVPDFENYARICFRAMPKVKHWITFNEPYCSSVLGYSVGCFAPGRTSDRTKSAEGDSSRECWIAGHTILNSHGAAVKIYRDEFKPQDKGEIGITLNGDWAEPWDPENPKDVEGCERYEEFAISWFADPIYLGKYPDSMRKQLGDRLPEFTPEEIALVHGSNDFYGMNHYTAFYIRDIPHEADPNDFVGNVDTFKENKAGEQIGPLTQSVWLTPYAQGFRKLLTWIKNRYGRPKIYITENGTSIKGENDLSVEEIVNDEFRCQYYTDYINALVAAVTEDDVDIRMYMAWSLLDNFEWADGYETRFGCTYVDYNTQKRYPKKSAGVVRDLFDKYIPKAEAPSQPEAPVPESAKVPLSQVEVTEVEMNGVA